MINKGLFLRLSVENTDIERIQILNVYDWRMFLRKTCKKDA